jgi:hypothetical protein
MMEMYPAKGYELANFVACVGAAEAAGQSLFENAKRGVNNNDSDNRSDTLSQKRKRHYLP